MVTLYEVITFLVSMQISISSLQTHNVNRCGRSRHLARKLSLRRKRSSPNVFEMAATETITSIILIKLIRVSLGTVRHPRRFKIVVIDIQITLKQMLRDFIGIRVNRAKKSGMVNITSSVNSRERSGINTILHELNPLFTINVTMRDIKSKNVYSRVNSKATTQWRKTNNIMVTLHEVITFLVSMQISISSLQTHNVNRCGRSRHLARKLSLRRKRSSPNVFEMAATETITSIILIKLIRVSLCTVRHPRRFKIVVIDIQITLKQMLRDFIGIRVNRAKKSGMVNITSSVNSRERSGINTILHELNPLFTINVTMRDIKSKNVYSRVNSKATTQWRKTESANGVHLEGVASDNRSS